VGTATVQSLHESDREVERDRGETAGHSHGDGQREQPLRFGRRESELGA
jgi:hypothetical protein